VLLSGELLSGVVSFERVGDVPEAYPATVSVIAEAV
jgi:hypothetical protein